MTDQDTQQFNVRIPRALADRVRMDAVKSGQTKDSVVAAIFASFLAAPAKDRTAVYDRAPKAKRNRRMRLARKAEVVA